MTDDTVEILKKDRSWIAGKCRNKRAIKIPHVPNSILLETKATGTGK